MQSNFHMSLANRISSPVWLPIRIPGQRMCTIRTSLLLNVLPLNVAWIFPAFILHTHITAGCLFPKDCACSSVLLAPCPTVIMTFNIFLGHFRTVAIALVIIQALAWKVHEIPSYGYFIMHEITYIAAIAIVAACTSHNVSIRFEYS